MPELRKDDEVFVLDLGDTENRFSPDWLTAVGEQLDTAAATAGALVTSGSGKFYTNGLDLEWLLANADQYADYVARVHELLARLLTFPVPTVAAINGHAFGAGAMFALANDYRVMRADRGYFCFPEADINIPFTPGMAALIQAKLTPAAAMAAMTTARRFGGPQARELGLVDEVAEQEQVLERAVELARPLAGKDRGTLGAIKSTMFATAASTLREPMPAA
ncbi:enoyl-CoA hydratase/isomerase family protein [Sciscionella sediminilitoris]|uniref:enoyl-CoA hydratase/isomerase family protein n=1 Tax=Sciscionella sediminilitoris TaxID=1445613 RepID=UPI0004DF14BE|nr:enoyl-CoA hydratase/isomerase family protein [Sciscionella sp. SE31]